MKTKKLFTAFLIAFCAASCTSVNYFQVYKAAPVGKADVKDGALVYEDENCRVSYDLWADGGTMGFVFFNKSDQNIYLNMEESFFVLNGIAYDYFKNRIFTESSARAAATSKSSTGVDYWGLLNTVKATASSVSGASVAYTEAKTVCIPPQTAKSVMEYKINQTPIRDCDLLRYPTAKQVKTKTFTKSDSPFVFGNRLVYSVGKAGEPIKFDNGFYVAEIGNHPENQVLEWRAEEYCGQKSLVKTKYFKEASPDKFYIRYTKNKDSAWKH